MKLALQDLAVFTGRPAFSEPLHVGRPNLGDESRLFERFRDILQRRWFTNNGHYVREFEDRVAKILRVDHCVAVCNGAIGLELLIRALGLSGEVIVPSFTFVATAHALQWQRITPVFCDIDPHSHTMDPACVEDLITPRTTAILAVHLWGRPCDVDALTEIAKRHRLKLLFDAAHAFGCSHQGKLIGGFGEAEVFSFHATKFVNTFEGGAVATNNGDLARKLRLMKNFGFAGEDRVVHVGTNGKMNEFSAAMGITCLESLGEFIDANRRRYEQYRSELQSLRGVNLISYDRTERSNYQYIVCELDEDLAGLSRDDLLTVLRAENVLARRYFYPGCHRMEPYRSLFPYARFLVPVTERVASRVVCLPTGPGLVSDDISEICQVIRLAVSEGPALVRRLRARRRTQAVYIDKPLSAYPWPDVVSGTPEF